MTSGQIQNPDRKLSEAESRELGRWCGLALGLGLGIRSKAMATTTVIVNGERFVEAQICVFASLLLDKMRWK
jgi:hypothetical protein